MESVQKLILVLMVVTAFLALGLTGLIRAGDLDAPAGPYDPASAMYTLEDVYNRQDNGAAGSKRTGGFTEPASAPGSTGHTVDEIMGKAPAADNAKRCDAGGGIKRQDILGAADRWELG